MLPFLNQDTVDTSNCELLNQIFSKEMIKMLFYHCCRIDIEDNNEKAELLQELLGPEFIELGTGTNRMAFLYRPDPDREFKGGSGLTIKIALDRRGLVDNFTEFKRSKEAPEYFIKAYETNMLILIEEYVTLMDQQEFVANEMGIKQILEDLSKVYIFEDIGFTLKNYANWGYRSNGDIVILDIGYVYPIKGNEHVLSCPKCDAQLRYNNNYTGFICGNGQCRTKFSFLDIRRRMDLSLEDFENQMISRLNNVEMPDFDFLTETIGVAIENAAYESSSPVEKQKMTPSPNNDGKIDLYQLLGEAFEEDNENDDSSDDEDGDN